MTAVLLFYGCTIGLGLIFGWSFVVLWRVCVPRGALGRVFSEMSEIAKAMNATDETSEFLKLYKRLLITVGRYVGRNLAGLFLACAPIVLVLVFVAPLVLDAWGKHADGIAAVPPLTPSPELQFSTQGDGPFTLQSHGATIPIQQRVSRTAVCRSWGTCSLFGLLGFHVVEDSAALAADQDYLVVRPSHDDGNFLWPYLSDLEFAFFLAFMIATLLSFLLPARKR